MRTEELRNMTREERNRIESAFPRDTHDIKYDVSNLKGCWLRDSNRWKHLVGGFALGLLLTFLCALGCAGGMEFKDRQWGGEWDWLDFLATILGGMIGQAVQVWIIVAIL